MSVKPVVTNWLVKYETFTENICNIVNKLNYLSIVMYTLWKLWQD